MKTSSRKAKGLRASSEVKDLLHKHAPHLDPGDILVTPSGVPGVDIHLSPKALIDYPFAIECKNQERIQIWAAIEQAKTNAADNLIPALFFRRNRSELYVALRADTFLELISKAPRKQPGLDFERQRKDSD